MRASRVWRVPATSGNVGPGFDVLGLTLNLYNCVSARLEGESLRFTIRGEGADVLPRSAENRIFQGVQAVYRRAGREVPAGLHILCENHIPVSSGMGSSAAAALAGVLVANDLLGSPFSRAEILEMAAALEGHADNAAPALLGGLTVSAGELLRRFDLPDWRVVLVTPRLDWRTEQARRVLPPQVSLGAAAQNVGWAVLTVEALRRGDLALLRAALQDNLHQPYRLPLLPGAEEALRAARKRGAAAALSGAGPSLIAFLGADADAAAVRAAMQSAFERAGLVSSARTLHTSNAGAQILGSTMVC